MDPPTAGTEGSWDPYGGIKLPGDPEPSAPSSAPAPAAAAAPTSADGPTWDPARNSYVQYDQARGVWMQYDDEAKQWKALDT